jgi:hypothetical protein
MYVIIFIDWLMLQSGTCGDALKPKANHGDRSGTLISDVDRVNEYFANISFDQSYNVNNVYALRRSGYENYENGEYYPLYSYEVKQL